VLGLKVGARVPQIVICEKIRTRSPRGSAEFCIPETFSLATPRRPSRSISAHSGRQSADTTALAGETATSVMIDEARDWCRAEWGAYPELAEMRPQGGDWLLRVRSDAGDRKPSTIVLGDYRKLQINGQHSFKREFFLPDGMTANEFGGFFAVRFGLKAPRRDDHEASSPTTGGDALEASPEESGRITSKQSELKPRSETLLSEASRPPQAGPQVITFVPLDLAGVGRTAPVGQAVQTCLPRRITVAGFAAPLSDQSLSALKERYRNKLGCAVGRVRDLQCGHPIILRSGEGVGKTTAHIKFFPDEALDVASNSDSDGVERFIILAFRSRDQAEKRAEEYRQQGYRIRAVRTFWDHYERTCKALGDKPISRNEFDEVQPRDVLTRIREEQPRVFDRLEEVRRALWTEPGFYSGFIGCKRR
jgi:hypothetical protein